MEIYHAQTYLASAQVQAYHAYIWHISQVHIFIIQKLKISNQEKNFMTKMAEQHIQNQLNLHHEKWKNTVPSFIPHPSPTPPPCFL